MEDIMENEEQGKSYYELLGVSILATDEEIRQAFRRRARETHPDRHLDDPLATPRFQSLQHAYEILKDPVLRNEYDRALLHTLALEEYLTRCTDLILTTSGLGLPLEHSGRETEIKRDFLEASPIRRRTTVR